MFAGIASLPDRSKHMLQSTLAEERVKHIKSLRCLRLLWNEASWIMTSQYVQGGGGVPGGPDAYLALVLFPSPQQTESPAGARGEAVSDVFIFVSVRRRSCLRSHAYSLCERLDLTRVMQPTLGVYRNTMTRSTAKTIVPIRQVLSVS